MVFLHIGHLNIITEGAKYGDLTVGILTDKAIASYKRLPFLPYETRSKTVESIKGVKNIIPQETLDYSENLLKLKPDYVIHGDKWSFHYGDKMKANLLNALSTYGGELKEIPYSKGYENLSFSQAFPPIKNNKSL